MQVQSNDGSVKLMASLEKQETDLSDRPCSGKPTIAVNKGKGQID